MKRVARAAVGVDCSGSDATERELWTQQLHILTQDTVVFFTSRCPLDTLIFSAAIPASAAWSWPLRQEWGHVRGQGMQREGKRMEWWKRTETTAENKWKRIDLWWQKREILEVQRETEWRGKKIPLFQSGVGLTCRPLFKTFKRIPD